MTPSWHSVPPALGGSSGVVTRDSQGRVSSFGGVSILTRDSAGRVATYSDSGVTYSLTRDSDGRVLEVATA